MNKKELKSYSASLYNRKRKLKPPWDTNPTPKQTHTKVANIRDTDNTKCWPKMWTKKTLHPSSGSVSW